jgi:hypothetical protein
LSEGAALGEEVIRVSKDSNPNQNTAVVLDQKAIAGTKKYLANVAKVTLMGTDYTPATLAAKLQSEVDAINALDSAKAEVSQQVVSVRGVRKELRAFRAALKKYLLSAYTGATLVQVLEEFGMTMPKNAGPQTVEAKAKASAKAQATRKAKEQALARVTVTEPAANAATVSTTPSAK